MEGEMTRIKWDFLVQSAKKITKMSSEQGPNHEVDTHIHTGTQHPHRHTTHQHRAHINTESTSDPGTQYIQVYSRVGTVMWAQCATVDQGLYGSEPMTPSEPNSKWWWQGDEWCSHR